jgi:hypothetical protein
LWIGPSPQTWRGNRRGRGCRPQRQGQGLQLEFTIEEEGVFMMPWSATETYRRIRGEWPEHVCAESPHVYYEKDTAVPTADKPDF